MWFNRCFLSSALFLLIFITACSGDDTEVEVIPEPEVVESESVEEIQPEPKPEPVVETIYVPTLESWGIEDGELEIVNGNCNLPIFRKIAFPHDFTRERITASQPSKGGPECLDDDNEGSIIEVPCVETHDFQHGNYHICISQAHCNGLVKYNDGIDYEDCKVQPGPPFIVASGRTNFYDNLFKRSTFYLDNRGRERHTNNAKSFIMAPTHIGGSLRRPSGNVAGKLYGRYNPGSQEYEDRKALWEACGIGTDPQIGSEKEDGRTDNGINGEWQETRTVSGREICLRLDTLPGAVKCLVTGFEDKVVLHTHDGEEELDVEIREKGHHKLCALFDEG